VRGGVMNIDEKVARDLESMLSKIEGAKNYLYPLLKKINSGEINVPIIINTKTIKNKLVRVSAVSETSLLEYSNCGYVDFYYYNDITSFSSSAPGLVC
jgi:hypothetical protein